MKSVFDATASKKLAMERELNALQDRLTQVKKMLQMTEIEVIAEKESLKRLRMRRQLEMKHPFQIDLSNLTIEEQLAAVGGSSATVSTAIVDGWRCCVKKLDLTQCSSIDESSFRKEISVLEQLPYHPNVCRYLFHLEPEGEQQLLLFMTQYETTLRSLLDIAIQPGPTGAPITPSFDVDVLCKFLLDIASGVEFLHLHDVLHRDLKSENVFLAGTSPVIQQLQSAAKTASASPASPPSPIASKDLKALKLVIGDFDTARKISVANTSSGQNNLPTSCVGTPHIIAPEVLQKEPHSFPADVYSFGMLVYELMTRELPYQGLAIHQVSTRVCIGDRPNASELRAQYKSLVWLYEQCTTFQATKRPTMWQVKCWLEKYLASFSGTSTSPRGMEEFGSATTNPEKSLVALAARKAELSNEQQHGTDGFGMGDVSSSSSFSPFSLSSLALSASSTASIRMTKVKSQVMLGSTILSSGLSSLNSDEINWLPSLHAAIQRGDFSGVKSQLSKLRSKESKPALATLLSSSLDRRGWTLLHEAISTGQFGIAKLLLDNGGSPLKTNNAGTFPFHYLASMNLDAPCQHLADMNFSMEDLADQLSDFGRLINATNENKETPLHYACMSSNDVLFTIQYLISRGADVNAETVRGISPLEILLAQGKKDLLSPFLEAGVEVRKKHFKIAANDPSLMYILVGHCGSA